MVARILLKALLVTRKGFDVFLTSSILILVILFAGFSVHPFIPTGTYRLAGTIPSISFDRSFSFEKDTPTMVDVEQHLSLGLVHPTHFLILHDDCIERFLVNGKPLLAAPVCRFPEHVSLDLSPYLHMGENTLQIRIKNNEGATAFGIEVDPSDSTIFFCSLVMIAAGTLLIRRLFWRSKGSVWQTVERWFCAGLIALRFFVLYKQQGVLLGFDAGAFTEVTNLIRWDQILLPVLRTGYSYHPPLAFLLPRIFMALGMPVGLSAEFVACCMSIVAFLFLRLTIKRLGFLQSPLGIAFLYITSSFPLQVYLAHSVNMDVHILAYTSIVLFCSVSLFQHRAQETLLVGGNHSSPSHDVRQWKLRGVFLLLIGAFAAALFTKASGYVMLFLPFVFFLFMKRPSPRILPRGWVRGFMVCSAAVFFAFLIVLPYNWVRYIQPMGVPVVIDGMPQDYAGQEAARAWRDQYPGEFFRKMWSPTPLHRENLGPRERDVPRLADAWKDLWARDDWLGRPPYLIQTFSNTYWMYAPFFLALGALALITIERRRDHRWWRFGKYLGVWFVIQVLALVYFIFRFPAGFTIPSKAVYISSATWFIGYVLSGVFAFDWMLEEHYRKWFLRIGFTGIALFMFFNHFLPVY